MAKDKKKRSKAGQDGERMKRKVYEAELRKLQVKLCYLQAWIKHKGLRAIIAFEGRDAAGKGGTIKAITERVSRSGSPAVRTTNVEPPSANCAAGA